MLTETHLLQLIQLASPALPVGAYSYSEGLETLVHTAVLTNAERLEHWLTQELQHGAVRVEAGVMVRAYQAAIAANYAELAAWNQWLSAFRETEELREQSWQMGRSLVRLLQELAPDLNAAIAACGEQVHFAIAFALAAAHWQIDSNAMLLGYLHSWATNLVNAGIKLIPLGQTVGQKLLLRLHPMLEETAAVALTLSDSQLECCSWGLAIASMNHETLYSRLFRS